MIQQDWLLTETFMADLIRFRHEVKDKTQVVETGSDFMVIAKAQAKELVKWLESQRLLNHAYRAYREKFGDSGCFSDCPACALRREVLGE